MTDKSKLFPFTLTATAHLLDIGKALHGSQYDEKLGCFALPLDDDELEQLDRVLDDATASIIDIISVIGALLAYSNTDELGKQRMTEAGFAINGLSELAEQLRQRQINVAYELLQREKARDKKEMS